MNKLKDINNIDDRFIEEAAPGMVSKEEMKKAFPEENTDALKAVSENADKAAEAKVVDITASNSGKSTKKIVNFKKWAGLAAALVVVAGVAIFVKGGLGKKAYDTTLTNGDAKNEAADWANDEKAADSNGGSKSAAEAPAGEDRKGAKSESDAKHGSESKTAEEVPSDVGRTDESDAEIRKPDSKSAAYDGEINSIDSVIGREDSDDVYEPMPGEDYSETAPDPDPTMERPPYNPDADAMLLTAGVWNDNNNWGFFTNLVNNGRISFPAFGLNPVNRIAVTVTDESGNPLSGCVVCASTDDYHENGSTFFTARTDKKGKAYLFASDEVINGKIYISVYKYKDGEYEAIGRGSLDEQSVAIPEQPVNETEDEKNAAQGSENGTQDRQRRNVTSREITVTAEGQSVKKDKTQVMFIVDTTGSMGDEIEFLQMDFSKIVEDVKAEGVSYSVNFYRDHGDRYVTKCNGFSTDTKEIQKLINDEYAAGGGDIPEAVAEILEETITENDEWSEDCNKIAFLIFDAPPHEGSENEEKLTAAIESAAKRGIRLVPVVASGSERETELFGRAMAIMTNGEYVFLTDDSGIGDSHLEPIIGDYEVEKLHDVIVRIIEETAE